VVCGAGTGGAGGGGEGAGRGAAGAYDDPVVAGTEGWSGQEKGGRMLHLTADWQIPLVLFAEGGGGRPGDTDYTGAGGLHCNSFISMAKLSGSVPLVGIVSGRCFAGNAALLGCCDVIIAARDTTLGMAGPAMIEAGGLGSFTPEEVGPIAIQAPNGVVDVVVDDEAAAVRVAKQYLSYFQGTTTGWQVDDQRFLRHIIPENRVRMYDIHRVIDTLCDRESVLELRGAYAKSLITTLVRIEGQPFGLMANNPRYLGGAIDAAAADKAARFVRLCNAFGLPLVALCDTPGFMVGPSAEKEATVRRVCRMFAASAHLRVPYFTVVLRKAYGLGAQAMVGGSMHAPFFSVAWPSAEFGAMSLEGAVNLLFKKALAAQENEVDRKNMFDYLVQQAYQRGTPINTAAHFELDAVIDPRDTRAWLLRGLRAAGRTKPRGEHASRFFIDTW